MDDRRFDRRGALVFPKMPSQHPGSTSPCARCDCEVAGCKSSCGPIAAATAKPEARTSARVCGVEFARSENGVSDFTIKLRRQRGLCPGCGETPAVGRKKCFACLQKNAAYMETYRANENSRRSAVRILSAAKVRVGTIRRPRKLLQGIERENHRNKRSLQLCEYPNQP